jgi:hypothetical protein
MKLCSSPALRCGWHTMSGSPAYLRSRAMAGGSGAVLPLQSNRAVNKTTESLREVNNIEDGGDGGQNAVGRQQGVHNNGSVLKSIEQPHSRSSSPTDMSLKDAVFSEPPELRDCLD